MEQSSYLDPDDLYIQCQNALEVIEAENTAYENLKLSLQSKVVDATSASVSVDNYKDYASDLCLVLDKIIEANELDKADFEEVKTALNTILTDKVEIYEDLIGSSILMNIENAQSSIETCKSMIESLKAEADSSIFASWAYSSQISEWESKLEGYESVLEEFRYKEQRYDDIESVTSGLFKDSIELRQIAWAALEEIVMVDGKYVSNADAEWRNKLELMDIQKNYGDLYDYLCGLTDENGNLLYSSKDVLKFIQGLKNKNIGILNALEEAKANNSIDYAAQLENIQSMIEGEVLLPNTQYSDEIRYYQHPNGRELFVPLQHGGGYTEHCWKTVKSNGGSYLDRSGCYYYSGASALSYILGDSVDMAYFLQCCGYDVDMSDPSSFTVSPAIADLGNNQPIALKINGEVVKNSQWDVILSNATGKEISQNYYNSSTPGWTYPSDISNVCYIVHQNMPGNSIGVIDTNGAVNQGHWVCIFPIGDNKYEVINYNPNGSKIVTHDQLTNLMCGQYELRWD